MYTTDYSLIFNHSLCLSLQLLLLFVWQIGSVILAFDLFNYLLHLRSLSLPLGLAHLGFLLEELIVWFAIGATEAIPQRRELAVVVVEVQVVHCMAGGTINYGRISDIFAVVDQDGPDVDEHEEQDVRELLQREDEGEDMVWY